MFELSHKLIGEKLTQITEANYCAEIALLMVQIDEIEEEIILNEINDPPPDNSSLIKQFKGLESVNSKI